MEDPISTIEDRRLLQNHPLDADPDLTVVHLLGNPMQVKAVIRIKKMEKYGVARPEDKFAEAIQALVEKERAKKRLLRRIEEAAKSVVSQTKEHASVVMQKIHPSEASWKSEEMKALAAEMQADLANIAAHSELADLAAAIGDALAHCQQGAEFVFSHPHEAGGVAYNYMMLVGNSVCGWLMAKSAAAAQAAINAGSSDRFYVQKIATARFFIEQVLPRNAAYLGAVKAGQAGIMALTEEDFEVA